jgi:Tol biopolymer transport system component
MGRRLALIIGNSIFRDPTLARLLTPDADVGALADVLLDPEIGAFDDVKLVVNMAASSIRRSISEFFANKTRDDLLLLYFSGHGVLDEYGRLYLATKETENTYLRGTAIPTSFITDEMDHSRSRRQVLILDCCHSGAFARGSKGATGASVGTAAAFEGRGYGRVVLTASDATQYAWEGDRVIGEAKNSVFTHHLVDGLQTGQADADGDGKITVDELYDYVYKQVVTQSSKQTPGKWSYREQGEIVIAQTPARAAPQPAEPQLPEFEEDIEAKLKAMFDSGLAAYWLEEWDKAIRAFQAIVGIRPDYPGAAEHLRDAQRQAEMAELNAKAQSALQAQEWDQAIAALESLAAQAPEDQDTASQLAFARERKRLAELYDQARNLAGAEKWRAASRVLSKIEESAPDYPDRDGLKALVDEKIAALERQQRIQNLYSQALKEIDAKDLEAARGSLSQLQEMQPGYAETERLLAKVEAEIERRAEKRQRQEQATALYRQAESLARAGNWPEVLSKMQALRQVSPELEDPEDLFASAQRQVELTRKASQPQAQTRIFPTPPPAGEKSGPEHAGPAKATGAGYSQPISYLLAHKWFVTGACVLIVLLAVVGLNAGRIFPPAAAVQTSGVPGRIAFLSGRDGNGEIYVMNADGSDQTRLTDNPANDFFPAWSPDGTRIAFESARDGNREIYVMNADGSGQANLTGSPADDIDPAWSPDGTRIAFNSNRDGNGEIYVMNADGSSQTRLTDNPADDLEPAWSPDGTRIAFQSGRGGNFEIYVMNADGSNQTRLTDNPADDGGPAWSPDGTRIAFESVRDGNHETYVMNADGSSQANLTNNPAEDGGPAWSPDGSRIAFHSNRDGNFEIYMMNADGSDQTRLTDNPADDFAPAWQP